MPDYKQYNKLNFLQGLRDSMQQGVQTANKAADRDASLQQLILGKQVQKELNDEGLKTRMDREAELRQKYGPGAAINISEAGISVTPKDNTARDLALKERHDKRIEGQQADLSKRYEKLNSFNSDLEELERITNTDGKGGVITNPDAKLRSMGGAKSVLPDSVMGLGEFFGMVPKGTSAERKALQRLQIDYQQAKSGMRVTDAARKQEAEAMGRLASGDPTLVEQAIRSLAHSVKNQYKTQQSGYNPEAVQNVHRSMGDPLALYDNLHVDQAVPGAPSKTPSKQPAAPTQAAPQPPTQPGGIMTPEQWKAAKQAKAKKAPGF